MILIKFLFFLNSSFTGYVQLLSHEQETLRKGVPFKARQPTNHATLSYWDWVENTDWDSSITSVRISIESRTFEVVSPTHRNVSIYLVFLDGYAILFEDACRDKYLKRFFTFIYTIITIFFWMFLFKIILVISFIFTLYLTVSIPCWNN